jgi:hypothetical protein
MRSRDAIEGDLKIVDDHMAGMNADTVEYRMVDQHRVKLRAELQARVHVDNAIRDGIEGTGHPHLAFDEGDLFGGDVS